MTPELLTQILWRAPGWTEQAEGAGLDQGDVTQILIEAFRVAEGLAPLAARADAQGCRIEDGRVRTPEGYGAAYRALGEGGWLTADLSEDYGGQGLPLALHVAASLPMEGAALPFMMLAGSSRAAAHCLAANAPELAAEWGPRLSAGEWAATICISEPDAGSDVGRIRTRATQGAEGWRIDGTKCWISFGDHDMAERIGHLCLARTGPMEEGTRGLSLFLVPNDGGVHVERIEEKLGLHGSPTCVLRFEGAMGQMIGQPGRGLPALFAMIERMRLQVGTQGAGVAADCARIARGYAEERRQGGAPDRPPVALVDHPDVQRQLLALDARALVLAGLVTQTAVALEARDPVAPMLLSLAKTFGGELGQEAASSAIQVLGGAGYTREWPIERHYRDARIMTIYEGTTGMQAQDFVLRRLLRDVSVLEAFTGWTGQGALMDRFGILVARLSGAGGHAQLCGADAMMRAGWCVVSDVLAARLEGLGPEQDRALALWRSESAARMAQAEAGVDWALAQAG